MAHVSRSAVSGAVAWSGRDLATDFAWIWPVDADGRAELERAATAALATGRPLEALTRDDFAVPRLAPLLAAVSSELEDGRGFAVLRGLDVDAVSVDVLAAMYWGIGTHLGTAIPQNARGDLLGHVRDTGLTLDNPRARGYQTRAAQSLHVDRCDVVALLCRRRAKAGGTSRIVSSMRIYNDILARAPHFIDVLSEPFAVDMRGEERPGEPPVYYRPVFSEYAGRISCGCNYTYIRDGQKKIGRPLTPIQIEALDLFYAIAEEHVLAMDLEPGDLQFVNNYVLLHDRSGYDDYDEPDRKRHMMRLWLNVPNRRPLAPDFGTYLFSRD